jgi:transcription antitermination factor NusG
MASYDPPGAWYAVYARPGAEKRAEMALQEAGFDSFMPFVTQWARSGRRKYKLQTPLFIRYLFAFIPGDLGERDFYTVRTCDGVDRIVGSMGTPIEIPTREVHALRQRQLLGDFDKTLERNIEGRFQPGDAVVVKVGKWAQVSGVTLAMRPGDRVRVLLRMFGRDHEKEFSVAEIEAA